MVKRIMVGMSGGVDSSVSAALLLEEGYEVIGATLRLYDGDGQAPDGSKTCCTLSDAEDARSVCSRLGIEHYVFNFKERFEKEVIDRFISEYESGKTPNPCIECNRHIKFKEMLARAEMLRCDKIATGHYAVIKQGENGRFLLLRANDRNKDQTYVLYSMTQHQLSRVVFPLGGLSKDEVRKIAERHGFINARKPDSQDICFVPDGDYASFIEGRRGASLPGDFVDENGKFIGKHNGIIRYTIGQRKGLGVALGSRTYVLDKDPVSNRVVLGPEESLFYKRVLVNSLNFIPFDSLTEPMRVLAKLRYRHTEQPAVIYPWENGQVMVEFDRPQRAPSPGQAAVFYDGEMVVGGGTIVKGVV